MADRHRSPWDLALPSLSVAQIKTSRFGFLRFGLLALPGALAVVACAPQPSPPPVPSSTPALTSVPAPPSTAAPTSVPAPTSTAAPTSAPASPAIYGFTIVNTFPHDPNAFTQGLVFEDGYLYESTGLRGQSTLRKVDLTTGDVILSLSLDPSLHAEGITVFNDRIIQLTFTSGIGFIYDQQSFTNQGNFNFTPEGWGVTHDGHKLIMSDGSSQLRFLDIETFEETARIEVTDRGQPVIWLNELEYVEGEIYANVWQSDAMARISPETGEVLGWIELSGLLADESQAGVLNGIAYDSATGRLFVTGKNWPKLFEIELFNK
jgi:glutamine cyclotransferase